MRSPWKVLLVLAAAPLLFAAEDPPPRFDPPDQLFRRAPMAQSSRSVVVNITTNLHLAFDTEKCRVHTVWTGPGLQLFGPPYHGAKTPFICTPGGEVIWEFAPQNPWTTAEGGEMEVEYTGLKANGSTVTFLYNLKHGEALVRIQETPFLLEQDGAVSFVREFVVSPSQTELHFLAHAELKARPELASDHIRITGPSGAVALRASGAIPIGWNAVEEKVDYSVEQITNEGTEKGNPKIKRQGLEARAYARIPAHKETVNFSIVVSFGGKPPAGSLLRPNRPTSAPQVFPSPSQNRKPGGDDFYQVEYFPVPPEIELLVTGMDWLPNGDLAISTWVGEIYIVEGATGDPAKARYRRFARGLNEPLGLAVHKGQIFVVQKGELTRIADIDADGTADLFHCINDDWGYSGNYHSYSFGPVIDESGNFYVFTTGQRARWDLPYQGYALRISPNGRTLEPLAHGLRAPNGHGFHRGDLFYVDNQGNWVGACKLSQIIPGGFHGFPSSSPAQKNERRPQDQVQPPAVWFPRELAPSSSGMETIPDERFGPFTGQLIVGDFQNAILTRVFLEKVNGRWQGAVFPFTRNFLSGVNRLAFGPDGKLYVGGVKRTWSAAAPFEYSLDRVSYTGELPFEVKEVRALPNGFELEFTKPVNPEDASDPENFAVSQFTYKYHQDYGSPQFDHEGDPGETDLEITSATVVPDGKTVRLQLKNLRPGFVTQFQIALLTSSDGEEIWHDKFWYTLNSLPPQ